MWRIFFWEGTKIFIWLLLTNTILNLFSSLMLGKHKCFYFFRYILQTWACLPLWHVMNLPLTSMRALRQPWNQPQAFNTVSQLRPLKALVILTLILSFRVKLDVWVSGSTMLHTKKLGSCSQVSWEVQCCQRSSPTDGWYGTALSLAAATQSIQSFTISLRT